MMNYFLVVLFKPRISEDFVVVCFTEILEGNLDLNLEFNLLMPPNTSDLVRFSNPIYFTDSVFSSKTNNSIKYDNTNGWLFPGAHFHGTVNINIKN